MGIEPDHDLGDRTSREAFVQASYAELFHGFCRLTGSQDRSADLTQEIFAAFWAALDRLTPGTRPKAWLYATGRNLWCKQARDHKAFETGLARRALPVPTPRWKRPPRIASFGRRPSWLRQHQGHAGTLLSSASPRPGLPALRGLVTNPPFPRPAPELPRVERYHAPHAREEEGRGKEHEKRSAYGPGDGSPSPGPHPRRPGHGDAFAESNACSVKEIDPKIVQLGTQDDDRHRRQESQQAIFEGHRPRGEGHRGAEQAKPRRPLAPRWPTTGNPADATTQGITKASMHSVRSTRRHHPVMQKGGVARKSRNVRQTVRILYRRTVD